MYSSAYFLLSIGTLSTLLGIAFVWRKTRVPHFVLGLILIYYYTLFGAWDIINVKVNSEFNERLRHLELSLFLVRIDGDYLYTIFIYSLFLFVLIITISFMIRTSGVRAYLIMDRSKYWNFAHGRLFMISFVSLILSIGIVWDEILSSFSMGISAYSVTRFEVNQYYTIHQLLNRIGLAAIAIGVGAYIVRPRGRIMLIFYLCLTLLWVLFLVIIGNRNELLFSGIAGLLWYNALGGRIAYPYVVTFGVLGFLVLRFIEITRGRGVEDIITRIGDLLTSADFWNPLAVIGGSESFSAHVSLYGIISRDIDLTYGSSLLYMASSLIPRIIYDERPLDIYQIYSHAISASQGQGFNIHYAAGWYLNFGLLGILMGAVILGWVWVGVLKYSAKRKYTNRNAHISSMAAFCFVSALAPVLMRGGPELLKGFIVEGALLPYLITWLALLKFRFKDQVNIPMDITKNKISKAIYN